MSDEGAPHGWLVEDGDRRPATAEEAVLFVTLAAPTHAAAVAALAAERYRRECAGVYFQAATAPAPSLIGTDPASQAKLNAAFVMAQSGHWVDGIPWKAADGSFVACTATEVMALAVKAATYVGGCYAHEAALTAALTVDLTTDITLGWPSNA